MGPFFLRLARQLESEGHRVLKVDFNGGDLLFSSFGLNSRSFRGHLDQLPWYLSQLISSEQIDVVFGYGDCRAHHRIASSVCRKLGTRIYFFEDGYLRPNYITLDRSGVNANSELPQNPEFYRSLKPAKRPKVASVGYDFWHRILYASLYYMAARLLRHHYPNYTHHRSFSVRYEAWSWLKSAILKYPQKWLSMRTMRRLNQSWPSRYYFFPLQIKDDAQIQHHSDFPDIAAAIAHVVASFAQSAPKDTALLIKHHPMDRGHSGYSTLINQLALVHGIKNRLYYIYDYPNPPILRQCLGVVTINSTMGISALIHTKKVKVLGRSFYDLEGLSFQGSLQRFWNEDFLPDMSLLKRFRSYLIETTQINQNFYKSFPKTRLPQALSQWLLTQVKAKGQPENCQPSNVTV